MSQNKMDHLFLKVAISLLTVRESRYLALSTHPNFGWLNLGEMNPSAVTDLSNTQPTTMHGLSYPMVTESKMLA